jgi:hypothetical protein
MPRLEITARSPLEGLMTPLDEGALTVEPRGYPLATAGRSTAFDILTAPQT